MMKIMCAAASANTIQFYKNLIGIFEFIFLVSICRPFVLSLSKDTNGFIKNKKRGSHPSTLREPQGRPFDKIANNEKGVPAELVEASGRTGDRISEFSNPK